MGGGLVDAGDAGVGPDAVFWVGDFGAFSTEVANSVVEVIDFEAEGEEAFAALLEPLVEAPALLDGLDEFDHTIPAPLDKESIEALRSLGYVD